MVPSDKHHNKQPSSRGSGLPFANSVKSESEEAANSPGLRKVLSKKAITPKKERNIEKATPSVDLLGKKNLKYFPQNFFCGEIKKN